MEKLIRSITDGRLPEECFEQEEFAGNAELTLNDGRKIEGFAQISLSERKLRLTPANPLPKSLDQGRINSLGFDETGLNLRMSLTTIDIFFQIHKARLDLNYYTPSVFEWPLEYHFGSCVMGAVKVPNKFASAIFGFENMEHLIGSANFHDWFAPHGLGGFEEISAFPPADKAREIRSKQLGMGVELRICHDLGVQTSKTSMSILMRAQPLAVARFRKSEHPNTILERLYEFVTFASILDGERIGFKFVTLKDVDANDFRFATNFVISERSERDWQNPEHKGVLMDALSYFDEFAKISRGHAALSTIADFSLNKKRVDISSSLVALSSAAEVLDKHIKGTSGNDMPEDKRFLEIFKAVQPFFLAPIPDKWAKTLVRVRNIHVHEKLDMLGDESLGDLKIEQILNFTQILHDILRAYAMLSCGMPRDLILKAIRGSDAGISFYGLRSKTPINQ